MSQLSHAPFAAHHATILAHPISFGHVTERRAARSRLAASRASWRLAGCGPVPVIDAGGMPSPFSQIGEFRSHSLVQREPNREESRLMMMTMRKLFACADQCRTV